MVRLNKRSAEKHPKLYECLLIMALCLFVFVYGCKKKFSGYVVDLKSDDSNKQFRAAKALGELGDANAVEPLIAALAYNIDWDVRDCIAEALAKIGQPAIEPLITALKDKNEKVYICAAEALAKIGQPAIEPLIAALKDKDIEVRSCAAEALEKIGIEKLQPVQHAAYCVYDENPDAAAKIGQPAVEPLIAALKDAYPNVRSCAAEALGKVGDPRTIEPLIVALKDKDIEVRSCAAGALGRVGDVRAIEPLIAALQDNDWGVRSWVAAALGELGDARAIEPLIAALKDRYPNVRSCVAGALGEIGDACAIEPLITALNDESKYVRNAAALALEKIGIEKLQLVQQAVYYVQKGNFDAATKIGSPAADPLISAFKNGDGYKRHCAAKALEKIGDAVSVKLLIVCLSDKRYNIRCEAGETLARIGQNSVELLLQHLKNNPDSDEWTRIVLALCGHKESADVVLLNLKENKYSAEMRCLLMGWFGSSSIIANVPFGNELSSAAKNQQLDDNDWNRVIWKTVDDPSRIELTLSSLSLAPQNSSRQTQVEDLCLRYIRQGDINIIPQLTKLLNMYGSKQLAEDYLNCGQSDLYNAANAWSRAQGYSVGSGYGSNRATWGSW